MTTHQARTAKQGDDMLCRDLIGVLQAMVEHLDNYEVCQGCGTRTDPEQPCPTCAERRRRRAHL